MKHFRIYGAIILAMIFWSLSFIWFKLANENYKPLTIIFLRLLFAVIMLSVYLIYKNEKNAIKKEDWKWFILLAVFEPFLYFIGESNGLTYVSSTTGSVIISTIPAVVALAAWLFFRERLRLINYAGIVLSFAGIVVFVLDSSGSLSFNVKGLLLLGLAVFSAAGYNITLGRLVGSYSPVFIVNIQNIIGVILFAPIFVITDFNHFFTSSHSFSSLLPVLELALFASCGAFILFGWSVRQIGVARVNPFTNFIPIFTAVFSFFILGNTLTWQNIAGMFIVIAGIFLSQINGSKKISGAIPDLSGKTA